MKRTLTEIYKAIEEAFYELFDKDLIKKSEDNLEAAGLPRSDSERAKILCCSAEQELKLQLAFQENIPLSELEKILNPLSRIKDLFTEAEEIKKEAKEKKDHDNLQADIQQAAEKKLRQLTLYYLQRIKEILKEIDDYLRLQQMKKEEKEREEKERLMRAALAAVQKLFEELEQSTAVSNIKLESGATLTIKHADIFKLADYRELHDKYFTNQIKEADYLTKRLDIIFRYLTTEHSHEITREHAVTLDNSLNHEMTHAASYNNAVDARQKVIDVSTEKLETKVEKLETKTEKIETETEKIETETKKAEKQIEKVEKIQAKENVDVEDSSLTENIKTASTDELDELNDLLGDVEEESKEVETMPSKDMPAVAEKIINTVKTAVSLEKKVVSYQNRNVRF